MIKIPMFYSYFSALWFKLQLPQRVKTQNFNPTLNGFRKGKCLSNERLKYNQNLPGQYFISLKYSRFPGFPGGLGTLKCPAEARGCSE